ncbi:hypothetical protein, variant [Cladophialophora immunda]|uniref:Uncharacterized protein n=1 Tax=Cladophialophora immunda TaxID=569365 RepID=A0A0D1ZWJ4_9EURO|nr:uncharacterized protein PV07_04043 [Cladophialophora immunda]XP_016252722.1 hypothetical protein, variant [Cladophialophora immunda]KIW32505.1 hypothetical protein PV07_04043 [Cladophialophora immunda]KIW32506.1 hypothetical protein, variant [Cladophialophora immunda]OQV10524.1 hypothetical protein CLAIMM_14509 [Cladophialophora immunda]
MPVPTKNLEPEIQYMVVEVLVAEFEWLNSRIWLREHRADKHRVLSTLLSLRLACQSFGDANIIKAVVFKEITLQATVLNFNRLRRTGFLSIAPFVKKINFLPTPFNISLKLRGFTRALEILSQHESDLPVRCKRHVATHWGHIPTTEAEVAAAFRNYGQQAYMDQDIINSGELQCLWTATLRTFRHANDFELLSLFGRHPLDPSDDSGTLHCKSCEESKCTLYDRTCVSESQMFRTAIQCLGSANAQIKSLTIHRTLAQHFNGGLSASWDLLDLSTLESFKFPDLEIVEDDYEGDMAERDAAVETCLAQFLRKPLPSLREWSVDHYVAYPRMPLPSLSHIFLPRLRFLTLGGILLRIPRLAQIVTSCVALEDITLRDCHPQGPGGRRLEDPGDEAWQPLFDALSQHPTLTHITIADEWDAVNNEGVIGPPCSPNTVGIEVYRVMLQTGMSAVRSPEIRGIWDAALHVYLG